MILAVALSLALQVAPAPQSESLSGPPEPAPSHARKEPSCLRDGNTLQLNVCALEDVNAEQARMQRYLDRALERAAATDAESGEYGDEPTRQVELLNAAQKAWEAYAEVRCDAQWDLVKGGTIRTIVLMSCHTEATRQRTHDIWKDHLTFFDSTPPLLPEPVRTVREEAQGEASSDAPADHPDTTG